MQKRGRVKPSVVMVVAIVAIVIITVAFFRYGKLKTIYAQADQYVNNNVANQNIYMNTYPTIALDDLWQAYKKQFIQKDGRTIDHNAQEITTSEGQSYSLLRAVWNDDRKTFDTVWNWTNVNLKKRGTDNLFAWKWGQLPDKSWGILVDQGGMNTASDADQDIALALTLAYYRWNDNFYLDEARKTLADIWTNEITVINGQPYLTAGNWANDGKVITVNPSYYSFAAYSTFAKINPVHDWGALKNTSYEVLNNLSQTLPPDWAQIDVKTGNAQPLAMNSSGVLFSQDAMRVPWRVALDWSWNQDVRAKNYLEKLSFFDSTWNKNQIINTSYKLDGQAAVSSESISMYSALLPYFKIVDPPVADAIVKGKIAPNINEDNANFRFDLGYYDANWVWFGLGLYQGKLLNTNQLSGLSQAQGGM